MQNLNVRIPRELLERLQSHCKTVGKTQSAFVRASIERCLADVSQPQDNVSPAQDDHTTELMRAFREELAAKNQQIESLTTALDHALQLSALSQKQAAQISERLEASEDSRHRPWWKRVFSR